MAVLDSHRAVSASDDKMLRVWDLASGQAIQTCEGHSDRVRAMVVVDSHRVISACLDRTLRFWDLKRGEELAVMTLDAPILTVAATPDGKIVVAGDQTGRVHFFDLVEAQPSRHAVD